MNDDTHWQCQAPAEIEKNLNVFSQKRGIVLQIGVLNYKRAELARLVDHVNAREVPVELPYLEVLRTAYEVPGGWPVPQSPFSENTWTANPLK